MIKCIFKGNIFLIIALFFAIPVVILVCDMMSKNNYEDILKYGIETEAHVISGTERSNLTVNGVDYYSIQYSFYDEKMVAHIGRTSESYTFYEIDQMIENEVIKIKYIPGTFDSVESDYDASNQKDKFIYILLIVFGIVDIVLWGISINIIRHNLIIRKVEREGTVYTAYVTGISSNVRVNNIPRYQVHYNYNNDLGESVSASSKSVYFIDEAQALEIQKQINIKAIGKNSVITSIPNVSLLYEENRNIDNNVQTNQNITCQYCGHSIAKSNQFCTNCGAKVINNDQEL